MSDSLSQDDLEHIRQLVKLVEDNGLIELSITEPEGLTVEISTAFPSVPQAALVSSSSQPSLPIVESIPQTASHPIKQAAHATAGVPLEAPMVGVFYRSQTPLDPPFAREGDVVQIGQTIGLIEAMKVFSEIPAERSGRIVEYVAKDGQLLQLGQVIAFIELL